jgi:uridylate kinase
MNFKRILLKLSGESLVGKQGYGIDQDRLAYFVSEIKLAAETGVQIAIVAGGGNIFRGISGTLEGFDRQAGDYMGMLATTINSLALQSELEKEGLRCSLYSGFSIESVTKKMYGPEAIRDLEDGKIVIISGGTGNPYFTTDTASALRALEVKADAFLKGTRVDGVYSDDPEKNPQATRFIELTFDEAYEKGLKIMDLTAFTLCRENKMPVVVFNMNKPGNLLKILSGEKAGTVIS